ncbi:hypothetical protein RIVM261_051480 [Rivularia sp. IAM M-261]|nr:hypothetical protein RIVM261_051480 [Rivularia sp. IAM M-261]
MSNQIIESNLLVELSDEQQENLAGGAMIGAIDLSAFEKLTEARVVQTSANDKGASTGSATLRDFTKSLGLSELMLKG